MAIGPTGRSGILAAVTARWLALYGPAGTTNKWFRAVKRGPVVPVAISYPALWCVDAGQRRIEGEESDNCWTKELTLQAVLQLAEDWTKVDPKNDWSDHVSQIISDTNRLRLAGYGIVRFDYVEDSPADILFLSGQSSAVWSIDFVVQYVEQG